MAKKKKVQPWEIAKPLLEEDYLANCNTDIMKPKDVVKLQSKYKDIEDRNFVCNFCNQKIAIKKLQAKAEASNATTDIFHARPSKSTAHFNSFLSIVSSWKVTAPCKVAKSNTRGNTRFN
jgi:hypothetical protein